MGVLLDAISAVKNHFGDTVCVTGRTAAPFSSVALAFGLNETMLLPITQPGFLRDALEFFVDYQTRFGLDQLEAGADAIWFGDCNASGHLISPDTYREFALEPARRVSGAYKKAGALTIYQASEALPALLDLMAGAGFSIPSAGPGTPLETAPENARDRVCLSGNIDPIRTLMNGSPADVAREVERVARNVSMRGGHVMNSGEMVPRDTPEDNVRAFVETTRSVWKELAR